MLKHCQSKNTNRPSNLNKTFSIISLLLIIFMLSTIAVTTIYSAIDTKDSVNTVFITENVKDLYVSQTREIEIYYMRIEINNVVVDNDAIDFYTKFTNNRHIAETIITSSIENEIPVNIAFAIAWKESRYDPMAYNDNGNSSDRGLFQLNDSYRNWTKEEFYDIRLNTHEGVRYMKEMVELNDGDYIYALYCYNAGPYRVRAQNIIPERTKEYVNEILEYEDMLNQEFNKWMNDKA